MGGILGLDTVDVPYYKKPKHKPCIKQFVLILSSGCLVIKKEKKQGVKIVQLGTGPPD